MNVSPGQKNSIKEGGVRSIVGGALLKGMKQLTGEGDGFAFAARGFGKW